MSQALGHTHDAPTHPYIHIHTDAILMVGIFIGIPPGGIEHIIRKLCMHIFNDEVAITLIGPVREEKKQFVDVQALDIRRHHADVPTYLPTTHLPTYLPTYLPRPGLVETYIAEPWREHEDGSVSLTFIKVGR